jgi:hypothetical protein
LFLQRSQDPSKDESSDSESDEDDQSEDDSDDSEDDPDGTNALIKAAQEVAARKLKGERKAKRKAEKAEMLRLAEKRKKKDIKLNQLTSISGHGGSKENQSCYRCGQVGHLMADCPKRGRSRDDDEGDRPRKSRKSR